MSDRKVALITGGTRGIGLGIAKSLAAAGYDLALNGMRPVEDIKEVIKELEKLGAKVAYVEGNLGVKEDREKMIFQTLAHFQRLNLLVNNAGVAPRVRKDVLEIDEDDYDYMLDINLKGTFFLSQLVANQMLKEKASEPAFEGSIITISSISAEVASINRGEYCMAKAGLGMMTKLLATRLGEAGIPVYEVRPGVIETDMISKVKGKYEELIANGLTVEKRLGQPEDIGRIVASLATGCIPYATGQVIMADGGLTLRRL
ncbi:MAG: 3-ketoacyl-ACP reductase [Imperialibacter sp.]|uniref:3-ketoacyl-ACP reductase n=1 Tax=Imperialibacter sp. TaxID=2038411 RepID=UPI0032ECFE99